MMATLEMANQQLSNEVRRQAEKSSMREESIGQVQSSQRECWGAQCKTQSSQQRQYNELWDRHQRLMDIAQWRDGWNYEIHADPSSGSRDNGRRQSMPTIPAREEVSPPPRRLTTSVVEGQTPSTVVYAQISDAPSFDESRYEDWEKAIQRWQEINAGTDQNRSLATLGMRAKGSLKLVLREYFDRTKTVRHTRSIEEFVSLMDEKFRRPTEELIVLRVEQWNDMKRKTDEGFKSYWLRLERFRHKLADLGIAWPERVAFQKAFTSLNMSREQQILVRAALEMSSQRDSLLELKRITVKLYDDQKTTVRRNLSERRNERRRGK